MSTDRLAEIDALLAAATPGPWTVDTSVDWQDYEHDAKWYCWQTAPTEFPVPGYGECAAPDDCNGHLIQRPVLASVEGPHKLYPAGEDGGYWFTKDDANLIAAAPGHLRWLIDELRCLKVAATRVVDCDEDWDINNHSSDNWDDAIEALRRVLQETRAVK